MCVCAHKHTHTHTQKSIYNDKSKKLITPHSLSLSLSHTHTHTYTNKQTAFKIAFLLKSKEMYNKIGRECMNVLDIEMSVCVWRECGDVSMVMALEELLCVEVSDYYVFYIGYYYYSLIFVQFFYFIIYLC